MKFPSSYSYAWLLLSITAFGANACSSSDSNDSGSASAGSGGSSSSGSPAGGSSGSGTAGSMTSGGTAAGASATGGSGGSGGATKNVCPSPASAKLGPFFTAEKETDGATFGTIHYADDAGPPNNSTTGGTPTFALVDLMPPRGSSTKAYSFKGTGFKEGSWGGGLGAWVRCTNASTAKGISLWYKSPIAVRVRAGTPDTIPTDSNGECRGEINSECVTAYAKLPAAASWTFASIAWKDFMGGVASGSPATFSPGKIQTVLVETDTAPLGEAVVPASFEILIDDLAWWDGTSTGDSGGGGSGGSGSGGAGTGGSGGSGGSM